MKNFALDFAKYLNGLGTHTLVNLDIVLVYKSWIKDYCKHDYVYKIMHDHRAADVCTICGYVKFQT